MDSSTAHTLDVAIGGFGAVGRRVARLLDRGIPGLRLVAVSARDTAKAQSAMEGFHNPVPVVPLTDLAGLADIVVECVPAEQFRAIAEPALKAGKTLVVISVGALLSSEDLIDMAATHGGRIVVPSGAILGLDAMLAAREGEIESVKLVTRKPVGGLVGAPYLEEHGIDIGGIEEPRLLFQGSAREAAQGFPANLNVAAALGIAGVGPDRTMVEIWADPVIERNMHRIEVVSDTAVFSMTIENIPSRENPKTGRITGLSIVAALRKLASPIRIGT